MKVMYTPLLSLNMSAVARKLNESLKRKKHDFPFPFYKVRRPSELEVKFMLKWDQPEGRRGVKLPSKGPQTKWAPEGGRKTMTMVIIMMMMMTIMTIMIIISFLHPKGPQTGLAPGGFNKL